MPNRFSFEPAPAFMEYKGIKIFYVYKDDDEELGPREFWFDVKPDSRDDDSFDVRELADQLHLEMETSNASFASDEENKAVLRAAIDAGLLDEYLYCHYR